MTGITTIRILARRGVVMVHAGAERCHPAWLRRTGDRRCWYCTQNHSPGLAPLFAACNTPWQTRMPDPMYLARRGHAENR